MNLEIILHAGLATGTILLFAAIGEIFAERAGVMNLGVEGMMLLGAMAGFSTSLATQNAWLGLIMAIFAGGILSLAHGLVTIHFQADQVVSGLSLTFLGTGLALVLGEGLTGQNPPLIPNVSLPILASIPFLGSVFFTNHSILVYVGYLFIPLTWYYIYKTRPGMHLRAVGEKPSAADTLGINVYRVRYFYVFVGGCLAGLAGATISLSVSPGWYSSQTTSGQGWIAVAIVIFAQWNPVRAAVGGYLFGMLRRFILDLQGPALLFGFQNPIFMNHNLSFFLQMTPFLLTIVALVWGSQAAMRKRLGSPAALGIPYIRGERGL
ncbi:MAG: ABC transporter permease [Chloroflexi bacterium GWB2_49_20]|nr:MAG: ABC transporter permease [Chloroflexi bacterium GWB2_49_20]OGN77643.1 MAG: ABC transporter permease [Chloroflexi bacterium GWC2_49_37]OGN86419.1 MAG: ABC transporter permease [Chloroflexi bacterium GWD2_49_16]HBG74657.1 ABC transporter permease [Anaerolineae bacterium]